MDKFYKTIASIQLQHDFYSDKNLLAASLTPFQETALFFKNHRMIFKKKKNQYLVLQETNSETKEPTIPFDLTQAFYFGINFNDPHYQLRSGLTFNPRAEKIAVEISEDENYQVSEKNIVPFWNTIIVNDEIPTVIRDKTDTVVFSSETDSIDQFNGLGTGLYKTNEKPFLKCINCPDFEAVVIFRLTNTESLHAKNIVMPAGSYHWRFKIQKKYTSHNSLNLVDENEKVSFNQDETVKDELFVFFSKDPVKLSEKNFSSLVLYNQETIVKKYIPLPELANARFLSPEERSLVLESYVTI